VNRPIGVFDSGVGGLSVLQALQKELPQEHFVYLADNAHAPYGEKSESFVSQRTHAIADHLRAKHHIKALVVACNTATAAAIHELRDRHPALPLVGVEPALKPALAISQTGRIGVMATRGTVGSDKFARLLAIEQSTLPDMADTAQRDIAQLLETYTQTMGRFGSRPGDIDTLVLGCTHYVFAEDALRALLGQQVHLVSTGEPVARQARRLLAAAGLLHSAEAPTTGITQLFTTGDLKGLQAAAKRWLGLSQGVCHQVPASLHN
jgi:glutamate racemase